MASPEELTDRNRLQGLIDSGFLRAMINKPHCYRGSIEWVPRAITYSDPKSDGVIYAIEILRPGGESQVMAVVAYPNLETGGIFVNAEYEGLDIDDFKAVAVPRQTN